MGIKSNIKYISLSGSASVFNLLISIVRVKIVSTLIGTYGIGLIGQLTNVINIATFVSTLGMEKGLVKEVANARSRTKANVINSFRATFLLSSICLSSIVSIVLFLFADTISFWLYEDEGFSKYIQVVATFSLTLGLTAPYSAFLTAEKLIKQILYKSIVTSILSTGFTVLLIAIWKIEGAVFSLLLNGVINLVVLIFFLKGNNLPLMYSFRNTLKLFRKKVLFTLMEYGSILVVSSLLFQVVNIIVKKIIVANSSIEQMGIYQAMFNITSQYLPVFLAAISSYLLPQLSEQIGKKALNQESNVAVRSILILAVAPLILIAALNKTIILLLYTEDFIAGSDVLLILIIYSIFNIVNKILQLSFLATKKLKVMLLLDAIVATLIVLGTQNLYQYVNIQAPALSLLFSSILHFIFILSFLKYQVAFRLDVRNMVLILMLCAGVVFLMFFSGSSTIALVIYAVVIISFIYLLNLRKSEFQSIILFIQSKIKKE